MDYKIGDKVVLKPVEIVDITGDIIYFKHKYNEISKCYKKSISHKCEFEWGEEVEVSDDGDIWYTRWFIGVNPYVRTERKGYVVGIGEAVGCYKCCRKPLKEDKIEKIDESIKCDDMSVIRKLQGALIKLNQLIDEGERLKEGDKCLEH